MVHIKFVWKQIRFDDEILISAKLMSRIGVGLSFICLNLLIKSFPMHIVFNFKSFCKFPVT